jgi:predicted nucleic acid-binding protein
MATYVDTSVIIARYAPSDPSFNIVERFFRKSSEARYISEISVLELHCVLSRLIRAGMLTTLGEVRDFDDLTVDEKVRVVFEHAVRTWRLNVAVPERSFVKFPISKQTLEIEHELFDAIRVSSRLGLKALDTLHLTYARAIKELAPDLEAFTTLDSEITSRREEIESEFGIRVESPDEST